MKKIGCVCLHGFTGAPTEVEPLACYLRERTDWAISVPVLPGHGEGADLGSVAYTDWVECAEQAVQDMVACCDEVYVVGFSMGGILACRTASAYPVKKLVLLSAAAKYINGKQLVRDIGGLVKDSFKGSVKDNELYMRYKNKIVQTPLRAAREFRALVAASRGSFRKISIPVFIAQGELDAIVPPSSAKYLYDAIPSRHKQLYIEKNAKHLICHCENNLALFKEVEGFLKRDHTFG